MSTLTEDARALFEAGLRGVAPARRLRAADWQAMLPAPLESFERLVVIGAGKASIALAGALEEELGRPVDDGLVVVPHGYVDDAPADLARPRRIVVREASHPVPDAAGVEAASHCLRLAEGATERDLVIVLISGGGSALWPAFAEPIKLAEAQETFALLLRSGATIHEINTVRKHLSRIGGGRLAVALAPATSLTLIMSDVVGDDRSVIASGPTVPDPTTYADAIRTLKRYDLLTRVPASVQTHLSARCDDGVHETPGPGHPAFERTQTLLLARNRDALDAMAEAARARGYEPQIVQGEVTGLARDVGADMARRVLAYDGVRPACLLWGGETTVEVRGEGRGGRNQELALAAALVLDGADRDVLLLSGGTDGIDGPTDVAGAWATPETLRRARAEGLDAQALLDDNDSYRFFEAVGQHLRTGPTHTNVMDVQLALIR